MHIHVPFLYIVNLIDHLQRTVTSVAITSKWFKKNVFFQFQETIKHIRLRFTYGSVSHRFCRRSHYDGHRRAAKVDKPRSHTQIHHSALKKR